MKTKRSIYAVIVTYNRKELLKECIEALLTQTLQVERIIIVDNASTDGTDKMLNESFCKKESIIHLKLKENIGGSGGFYEGIKYAYENNADWIWIMDDDSEPTNDCLKNMLEIYDETNNKEIGVVCPLIQHKNSANYQWYHHKLIEKKLDKDIKITEKYKEDELLKKKFVKIDSNAFVGPLINRKAIEVCGLPEKDYFIWCDDLEYIYRISRKFECLLSLESLIYHKDNNFEPNTGKLNNDSIWKLYYGIRNRLLFINKYQKSYKDRGLYYLKSFVNAFKTSLILLIFKKAGKKSIIPLQGFLHGIINKKGKIVVPFKL